MIGSLPRSLRVNDVEYAIRTDFRDVLNAVVAFGDPDLKNNEKVYICLLVMFEDFPDMPQDDYEAAFKAALAFIDGNSAEDDSHSPRVMDWEQDENIMFPAINKVAGFEVRAVEYLHWWTFLGYYMEITDGVFSNVLSLRMKKAKGKPLEKWEREFWSSNRRLCVLKEKLSEEEQKEKDKLNALLG